MSDKYIQSKWLLLVIIELRLINLLGRYGTRMFSTHGSVPERRDVSGMLGQAYIGAYACYCTA